MITAVPSASTRRDRVRQVPRVRERPPVAGVVAAEALARALEQVADEDAGGEPVPVVPGPAVLVRERREEQRRVGDPAGDHDVGALRERVGDRARAEVRGREQRRRRAASRTASPVSRCANAWPCVGVQRVEAREHVVAEHGRDLDAGDAHLRARSRPRRASAAAGLMPPAFVMIFVRPSATNGSARARYAGRSRV